MDLIFNHIRYNLGLDKYSYAIRFAKWTLDPKIAFLYIKQHSSGQGLVPRRMVSCRRHFQIEYTRKGVGALVYHLPSPYEGYSSSNGDGFYTPNYDGYDRAPSVLRIIAQSTKGLDYVRV